MTDIAIHLVALACLIVCPVMLVAYIVTVIRGAVRPHRSTKAGGKGWRGV